MTLIIGIKCSDGVIVGADGAATLGSLDTRTAEQPTKKLYIHHNKIIIGVSGAVGLGQRLNAEIDRLYSGGGLANKEPDQAMTIMSTSLREHILPELKVAAETGKVVGNAALNSAITASLIALPIKHKPCLFQFDHQGSPEESTEELPFACVGSGQTIADPFLGFIRRVFWNNGCPNINQAIFATIWTLQHAISLNTGGVSEPIQIMGLIKPENGDWEAKEYSETELSEHKEAIIAVEGKLKEFKQEFHASSEAEDIPTPQ